MNDGYHGYPPHARPHDPYVDDLSANFDNLSLPASAPLRNTSPNTYPRPGPPGQYANQGPQPGPPLRNYGDAPRRPPPGAGADGWNGRQPPQSMQRRPGPPAGPPPNNYGRAPHNTPSRNPAGRGQYPAPPPAQFQHQSHGQGPGPVSTQFHRPRPPPSGMSEYSNQGGGGGISGGMWAGQQAGRPPASGYDRQADAPLNSFSRSKTMPFRGHPQRENQEFSQGPGDSGYYGGTNYEGSYDIATNPPYNNFHGYTQSEDPNSRGLDPTRGSVGDVLDLYTYDDSYGTNGYHDARSNSLQQGMHRNENGHNVDPRYIYDPHQLPVPENSQAYRSKSQPNLRGDGLLARSYTAPFPPPLPPQQHHWNEQGNGNPGAHNNSANYGNRPPFRINEASNQPTPNFENGNVSSSRPPPQRVYPNQTIISNTGPTRTPVGTLEPSRMVPPDDPDALPEHPAPIRPGLSGDNASIRSGISQNGSTTTQNNPSATDGKMSIHDLGPVTFDMLNLMRNEIASRPVNQPVNASLQFRFARRLVEASFSLVNDTDPKAARRSRENFTLEAHKIIKKLSSGTHPYPEAMFYLANCYGDGTLGLEVDHDRAFSLYQSAAKLNHPPSAYRTAVCCEIGAGTKKEPQKAFQWYRKAATFGDTAAMYKVGMIQHKGLLGQPRNDREAIVWLKRAAEQADEGNPHALHQLGILYESADGNGSIVRDAAYAKELFTKAAELGYPPSQYVLGTAYAYGTLGCPIDAKLSITWYSRAASNGDAESELALAGWYLTGAAGILEQNDTEAYLWSRKAAEQGLAKAEYAVGHLTELGIGLDGKGSDEEARNWYFRAAGQGHTKAKERLEEMRRGAPKKTRERLSRNNKAKDDADCVVM
ncbi:hypothetical protein TWF569_002127 [Orbilia oligospora]|uniref:Uncharacterized protein n=1 Tax=Orbilia oligospora TaxID=2813651 RepID=A0A7C8NHN3_ORBOL|nr:hypothetical protein TWF102_003167 [Orbilia oligospora]KAF3084278.1 hypothetical protein TWF103_002579 [Orbilia oligospora]KAF3108375.1 hypothetical protein TWF706_002253 [Orbilia oligospora]KAF3122596.1 hypothetical protein TWF569_002127 [Orbilia oligospora]KAF3129777.1 hypothetical protein TWF703_008515 [Orbilia oligospora]